MNRDKYRIRYYNKDPDSLIHLEKKSKRGDICIKSSELLSKDEAQRIVNGDILWMSSNSSELIQELYHKMTETGLRPKTIVDYTRVPFVYPYGNVRVTLDHNIRTGLSCVDFLNPDCITIPIPESDAIILEVKWDEYLPDVIKDLIQLRNRHSTAFSKYAACRSYDI